MKWAGSSPDRATSPRRGSGRAREQVPPPQRCSLATDEFGKIGGQQTDCELTVMRWPVAPQAHAEDGTAAPASAAQAR